MYQVACPSCGAQVAFRSAASVMAVCEYCRSTLLKDADSVKDIGKMSSVIEDFSPIQITTSGNWQGKRFGVVGRIQLRYDAGLWNEWYLLFDDGSAGWLSDASGQYILTVPAGSPPQAPAFEQIKPGATLNYDSTRFVAADVRTAQCVAGEGELPFRVGDGYAARVADFRAQQRFLTLDYSDSEAPIVYAGEAVTLNGLQCQLLRSPEQIVQTAGRYRGKTQALDCPSCGSPLSYQAGMATHLLCPSCHAEVDCGEDRATVLKKHDELETVKTTLALGDEAKIDGTAWTLIGLMRCREFASDGDSTWTEYLLFNTQTGFLWLVETADGWERVEVLNQWPDSFAQTSVRYQGDAYNKLWEYGSEVIYAAGAFNWRVSIGDKTMIADYRHGEVKLSQSRDEHEITWSRAEKASPAQIAQWFGKTPPPARQAFTDVAADIVPLKGTAKAFTWLMLILNLPMIFGSGLGGLVLVGIALLALWWPVWNYNKAGSGDGRDDD